MYKYIVLVSALILSSTSRAEEKQTPTDAFRGVTQYKIMMCRISTQTALNKVQLGELKSAAEEIGKCIKEGKVDAKKKYPAALAKVSKNPAAAKLLKDYYASWITAIDGVAPNVSDTKQGYSLRQDALDAKYDEVWNRFEIEAGL